MRGKEEKSFFFIFFTLFLSLFFSFITYIYKSGMFHSSGSRREQYLVRPSHIKATLNNKKRTSLESQISGADSGYTSSSSTPSVGSPTIDSSLSPSTPPTSLVNDATPSQIYLTQQNELTVKPIKKKKSAKSQSPRQPDLVYSCPRPLAFPFHNDDHFLPIAEADPRDVARVSPSINRASSIQSSKASIGSTHHQYSKSNPSSTKGLDTESSYSHQSSILSTIQRGTVRSIRSLFQLPDSLSNRDGLSRLPTNNTSHTQYSANTRRTNDTNSTINAPLERLEIKKGTVQSIKDMFSLKRSNTSHSHQVSSQPVSVRQQKGVVGATIGQFESSFSRATVSSNVTNKKKHAPFKPVAVNVTKSTNQKSFTSRATDFASKAIWKPKAASIVLSDSPPPVEHTPLKSLKEEVKKISARVLALPKSWRRKDEGNIALPVNDEDMPPNINHQKKSIFSSFRRSDISASVSNNKKLPTPSAPGTETTTKVGKMWKSFKNMVSGKKTSRVGVL